MEIEPNQKWLATRPSEEGHAIEIVGLARFGVWLVRSLRTDRQYEMRETTIRDRFARAEDSYQIESPAPLGTPGV